MSLAPHPPLNDYPSLSEYNFARSERRHPTVPLPDSTPGRSPAEDAYLDQTEMNDRIAALHPRPLDRAVLELRLRGLSIRAIAEETGLKRWRVEEAIRRLRRAWRRSRPSPTHGWQAVYRDETNR